MLCQKEFGFFDSEHQCKRCKRAVCEKCSPNKAFTIKINALSKEKHRICNFCKEESEAMKKFINQQKIAFQTNTYSIGWLKSFGYTLESAQKEYELALLCNDKEQSEFQKMQDEFNQVYEELLICYNYSLKEFFYLVLNTNDSEAIKQTIQKVLATFLKAYPEVGYTSDQVFLTLFLLCFCNEASAYSLLTLLYAEIIPSQIYPANLRTTAYDYSSEIEKTLSVLVQAFKMSMKDVPIVRKFLLDRLYIYILPLTLNFFMFETTFFIIDQMFSNPKSSYDDLSKYLGAAFQQNISDMKELLSDYNELELIIMRNIKSAIVQDGYFKTKSVNLNQIIKPFARASAIITRQKTVIVDSPNQVFEQQINDLQEVNFKLLKENSSLKKVIQELELEKQAFQTQIELQMLVLQQVSDQEQKDLQHLSIAQDEEYINLRRGTIQLLPNDDIEKRQLIQLVQKLEHALLMENKINEELKQNLEDIHQNYKQYTLQDQDVQKQLELQIEQLQKSNTQLTDDNSKNQEQIQEQNIIIQNLLEKELRFKEELEEFELQIIKKSKSYQEKELEYEKQQNSLKEQMNNSLSYEVKKQEELSNQLKSITIQLEESNFLYKELKVSYDEYQNMHKDNLIKSQLQYDQTIAEVNSLNEQIKLHKEELINLQLLNDQKITEISSLQEQMKLQKEELINLQLLNDQKITEISFLQEQMKLQKEELINLQLLNDQKITEISSLQEQIKQNELQKQQLTQNHEQQLKLIVQQHKSQNETQLEQIKQLEQQITQLELTQKERISIIQQEYNQQISELENTLNKQQLDLNSIQNNNSELIIKLRESEQEIQQIIQKNEIVVQKIENDKEKQFFTLLQLAQQLFGTTNCELNNIFTKTLEEQNSLQQYILKEQYNEMLESIFDQQNGLQFISINKQQLNHLINIIQKQQLTQQILKDLQQEHDKLTAIHEQQQIHNEKRINQILQILNQLSEHEISQIFTFSENRVYSPIKQKSHIDDAMNVVEAKNQQITMLKQLLKDSQLEQYSLKQIIIQIRQAIGQ